MEASVTVPPGPGPSYARPCCPEETQRRHGVGKTSLEDSPLLGALRWRPRCRVSIAAFLCCAAKGSIATNMQDGGGCSSRCKRA